MIPKAVKGGGGQTQISIGAMKNDSRINDPLSLNVGIDLARGRPRIINDSVTDLSKIGRGVSKLQKLLNGRILGDLYPNRGRNQPSK